jgi:hypothetical protein
VAAPNEESSDIRLNGPDAEVIELTYKRYRLELAQTDGCIQTTFLSDA